MMPINLYIVFTFVFVVAVVVVVVVIANGWITKLGGNGVNRSYIEEALKVEVVHLNHQLSSECLRRR